VSDPATKSSKVPTRQRTTTFLIVGLVLAALAAALLLLGSAPESKDTFVLRAERTIPSLSVLEDGLFEAVAVTEENVPEGAITGSSEEDVLSEANLDGKVAQYPIAKGRVLLNSDLTTETAKLEEPLGPNERLVSVPAQYAYAVAGNLRAGDRVDVYGLGPVNGSTLAQLIVSGAEVAGVALGEDQIGSIVSRQVSDAEEGKDTSPTEALPGDPIPGVYTLRVDASIAARLALLADEGKLYLTYRGAEGADVATGGTDLINALCGPSVRADGAPVDGATDLSTSLPAVCPAPGI
jgi:Flp pilus assembly protein CpaB